MNDTHGTENMFDGDGENPSPATTPTQSGDVLSGQDLAALVANTYKRMTIGHEVGFFVWAEIRQPKKGIMDALVLSGAGQVMGNLADLAGPGGGPEKEMKVAAKMLMFLTVKHAWNTLRPMMRRPNGWEFNDELAKRVPEWSVMSNKRTTQLAREGKVEFKFGTEDVVVLSLHGKDGDSQEELIQELENREAPEATDANGVAGAIQSILQRLGHEAKSEG